MIRKIFQAIGLIVTAALLTILTQVGGLVLLMALGIAKLPIVKPLKKFRTLSFFIILYALATAFIVPSVARLYGREPLNVFTSSLRPLNIMTCVLNRHYVKPELKGAMLEVATQLNVTYPGTILYYLDGSFPFINKFPLIPHLSHNDGKKLDICFFYKTKSGENLAGHPSPIGYGVFEGPKASESNMPAYCNSMGYWQYGIMEKLIPQNRKAEFLFDERRTKSLIMSVINHKSIRSIYIEPHLKERLSLNHGKIRFHGCFAVRHDDHIHVNLD
jgi:hypothetical protein